MEEQFNTVEHDTVGIVHYNRLRPFVFNSNSTVLLFVAPNVNANALVSYSSAGSSTSICTATLGVLYLESSKYANAQLQARLWVDQNCLPNNV